MGALRAVIVFRRIGNTPIDFQILRKRLLPPQVSRNAAIVKTVIERIGVRS
jgi:hypothetical protein